MVVNNAANFFKRRAQAGSQSGFRPIVGQNVQGGGTLANLAAKTKPYQQAPGAAAGPGARRGYAGALSNALATKGPLAAAPTPAKPTTPATPAPAKPKTPAAPVSTMPSTPVVPTGPAPTATGAAAMAAPTVNSTSGRWNSNQSIPDYLGMTPDMIQKALGQVTTDSQYYDPEKDPVYQAMFQLGQNQSKKATANAMEVMNERGILNSTVASDRMGQINQSASDAILGSIPGLAANFDNKQMANMQALQSLIGTVMQGGQFQQTFAEDNRRFDKDFALEEAAVTGRYMTPEAQESYNKVLDAKRIYANPNSTRAQKDAAKETAVVERQKLASAGYDISGLGADASIDTALRSGYYMGRDSLPQQAMDLERAVVTGEYNPTTAQGLIERVLAAKDYNWNAPKSDPQRQNQTAIANAARQQLASMGIDTAAIGGDVDPARARQNVANGLLSTPTLANRQFEAENAFAEAQLTGNYLPPGANALVNELLAVKDRAGQKGLNKEEKAGLVSRAQTIRNSLTGMGINAEALFGANVTADKAKENAARLGRPTLDAIQQSFNNALARDQFGFEKEAFDREMDFTESSFDREMNFTESSFDKELGFNKYTFDREMNFTESSFDKELNFNKESFNREMSLSEAALKIESDLKSRGLDIEEVALGIDRFIAESDADYKGAQKDLGINDQTAATNTQAAIGEALAAKSGSDAMAFISKSAKSWANKGVDVRDVMDAVYMRWPEVKDVMDAAESATSFGTTP